MLHVVDSSSSLSLKLAWELHLLDLLVRRVLGLITTRSKRNFCNVEEKRPLFFSDNCGQTFGKFAEKVCIRIL